MGRGQTTFELLMILAVSMVALAVIYSLYSDQLYEERSTRDYEAASVTLTSLVNAANSLHFSGAGSKTRVLVELPDSLDMNLSDVNYSTLTLGLFGGNTLSATADVNFFGDWKKINGIYVKGGYYVTLIFDGNNVNLVYDDFDISDESIIFSAEQGSISSKRFSIKNNSSFSADFWIEKNFSFSNASLQVSASDLSFTLPPGGVRVIDFNVILLGFASGNYSGLLEVTGELSDGVSDVNVEKSIVVSVEAYPKVSTLAIFPKVTSLSATASSLTTKSFSICNSDTAVASSLYWRIDSNADANMATWLSWPPLSGGVVISSLAAGSCTAFDLNITVPGGAVSKTYDANISATKGDLNKAWGRIVVFVS